jgi:hypothetical protein
MRANQTISASLMESPHGKAERHWRMAAKAAVEEFPTTVHARCCQHRHWPSARRIERDLDRQH